VVCACVGTPGGLASLMLADSKVAWGSQRASLANARYVANEERGQSLHSARRDDCYAAQADVCQCPLSAKSGHMRMPGSAPPASGPVERGVRGHAHGFQDFAKSRCLSATALLLYEPNTCKVSESWLVSSLYRYLSP